MRNFSRKAWPFLIACILHAILLASLGRSPAASTAPPEDALVTIALEDEPAAPAHEAPSGEAKAESRSAGTATAAPTIRSNEGLTAAIEEAILPAPSASALVGGPHDAADGWSFDPTGKHVDLGLGDKRGTLARAMAANGALEEEGKPSPGKVIEA